MSNGLGKNGLWAIALVSALGFGVVAAYVTGGPGRTIPDEQRRPERRNPPVAPPAQKTVENPVAQEDSVRDAVFGAMAAYGFEKSDVRSVKVAGGTATVDFGPKLTGGMGSFEESQLLKELQRTLGAFPEVERIQISVDGQVLDSLGHFEIESPLTVIRPDGSAAGRSESP